MKAKLIFGRFDYAAFTLFSSYAAISLVIPTVLVQMARGLGFPLNDGGMETGGMLHMYRSIAMCVSLAACGFVAAKFGNRRTLGFAASMMGIGILLCALSPSFLFVVPALLVAGFGEGIIEGLGTPFVQDLHEKDQSRYVNFTHGFWALGIMVGVLVFGAFLFLGMSWRIVLIIAAGFSLVPVLLLFLPAKKPYPEKQIGTSSREVFTNAKNASKNVRFWLYFVAMLFAGGGEYCLSFWCSSFIQLNFAGSAFAGALGTAIFSLGMFLGRTSAGALISQKHLKSLLVWTGVFASILSLLIPPFANHLAFFPSWSIRPILYVLLFLCGVAAAPFWPSIQSLCVERLPHLDSTMLFILLSCAGVPGGGIFCWLIGVVGDHLGLAVSFYLVPTCYLLMVVLIVVADLFKPRTPE